MIDRGHLPEGARLRSFSGLSLRTLRARPLRSGLTASAIVLGVGMVFGVLLLVGTIHSTFGSLFDAVYGRTDIVISGKDTGGAMDARTMDVVRGTTGVGTATGTLSSFFSVVDARGRVQRGSASRVYVAGTDYAEPDPTDSRQVAGRNPRTGSGEIEVDGDWARRRGLGVGDRVTLATPTGVARLRISGVFELGGGMNLGGYGMASIPVADARRLMDKPDTWDEIAVVAAKGADVGQVRARLARRLPEGVDVVTPQTKVDQIQEQLAGLDVVLYFFSGIALFVGGFLILNSFNMTVLQRMRELGTLRALGASDRRVAAGLLSEAIVLGAVGCVAGLALGAGLAVLLLQAIKGFGMPIGSIEYSWTAVAGAVVTGMLAAVLGAMWPAARAARIAPVEAMRGYTGRRDAAGLKRAIAGVALFVPGMVVGGLFWFGDTSQGGVLGAIGGIGATVVLFVGMVLLAPFLVMPLVALMARPLRAVMPAEGRLAADAARSNPARTAATAATLLVAISVVVVNSTMASSFVGSVKSELDARFARDLTVQPLDYQDGGPPAAGLSRRLREQIAAMPEAAAIAQRRALLLAKLPGSESQGLVVAYDPYAYDRVDRPEYVGAPRAQVLRGLADGGVVATKSYAATHGLHVGGRLTLEGPGGTRSAPIVGLIDSLDGGGLALQVSLETIAAIWGVRNDVQLAVKARSPEDRAALARRVDALLARDYPSLEALSNAQVKARIASAVDQQFSFFNAIVAMAVLVGMLGIVNTLSMSVLERTREIGVLRALGASRWRVRRTMGDESLLISIAGTIAGIVMGLVVGLVWIVGMRQRTFPGLELHLPTGMLVAIAVLGLVLGVGAAVLPARRAARLDPLAALRYE